MSKLSKPIREHLVEVRDDVIVTLDSMGYNPTQIALIMNRSKQLVSYVINKISANHKNNARSKKAR